MQDKLFESAFEYAAIGMALVALNGRWLKTNAALCQFLGYSEAELLQIDFQTITHADDLNADLQQLNNLLAGRITNYQMEKRYIHKQGAIIWSLLSVSLVANEDGSPGFFISQVQDISARKNAEQERDAFFVQTVDMLAIIDSNDAFIEVNPAWTKCLGWTLDELKSRQVMDFLHPDDYALTQQEATRVHAGHEPTPRFRNRFISKHLEYRWLEWNTSQLSADKAYCSVRDVTERVWANEALSQSEQKFQDLASNVPGIVYQFEWYPVGKGRFTYVSPKVMDILGLPPEALLENAQVVTALIHADDIDSYYANLERCSRALSYRYWEGRYVLADGRTIWSSLSAMPRQISDGGVLWTGLQQDITAQKLLSQQVAESENLYRSLISSLSEGVLLVSADNAKVLTCNQSALLLLGMSEQQLLGSSLHDNAWNINSEGGLPLANHDTPANVAIRSGQSVKNKILGLEIPGRGLRWLSVSAEPLFKDGETEAYAAVTSFFDVTDIKELTEKLAYQAHVDFLTGAYSRGYFYELANLELSRAQRYGQTFALMILDIDFFKKINDQYGHDAGDKALQRLVGIIKEILRDLDVIGRLGGEEFVVLLPQATLENAVLVAERIRKQVSSEPVWGSNDTVFKMTVSIGLAQFNTELNDIDSLMKAADVALYDAKKSGRNRVSVKSE